MPRVAPAVALSLSRVVALAVVLGACKSAPRPTGGGDAASKVSTAPATASLAPARFSRPIAAIEVPPGVVFVAGLVASRGVVAVTLVGADGGTRWTVDVLSGVTWSPNATLAVVRSHSGAVVVWRGLRGKDEVTLAVGVAADGKVQGEPFPAGAASCATDAELAWLERGPRATWRVQTRSAWGAVPAATAMTVPEDREPVISCSAHRVFVLGDGDDDVTLQSWGAGAKSKTVRVIEDADFRGDEERGHELYAVGDVLGLVRLGASGTVASREVTGESRFPWRKLGKRLTDADDVALVDADARIATLAFTREAPASADASSAPSVEALVWERAGSRDATYTLAPGDPTHVRGPFWSGAVTGGVVVAWAERSGKVSGSDAPIVGLGYRVVSLEAPGELRRIDRPADELVDAGCDDVRCYAVALARAPSEDGGQPEVAEVLRYP